jgi:hypothetical protein
MKRITKTYRPIIQLTDTKTLLNITKQDITMAKSYNLLLLLLTILVLKKVGILKGSAAGLMRDES